jgi:hypothetical protein
LIASQGVNEGLTRLLSDTPLRSGYMEAMGGYSRATGMFGRGEFGLRPTKDLGAFLFGQWDQVNGPYGGLGLRWDFNL